MNTRTCWFQTWGHASGKGPVPRPWCRGKWHAWGQSHEEYESGPGNFPVAIVEDENGRVHVIPAEQVAFGQEKPED